MKNKRITKAQKRQIKVLHGEPLCLNAHQISIRLGISYQNVLYQTSSAYRQRKIEAGSKTTAYRKAYNKRRWKFITPEELEAKRKYQRERKKKQYWLMKKRREYMRKYMKDRNDKKRGGTVAEIKQRKIDLLLQRAKELRLI